MGTKLIKYTYVHEPTEVIIVGHASSYGKMREFIDDQVKGSPFTFPEGKWNLIGSNSIPEEW